MDKCLYKRFVPERRVCEVTPNAIIDKIVSSHYVCMLDGKRCKQDTCPKAVSK